LSYNHSELWRLEARTRLWGTNGRYTTTRPYILNHSVWDTINIISIEFTWRSGLQPQIQIQFRMGQMIFYNWVVCVSWKKKRRKTSQLNWKNNNFIKKLLRSNLQWTFELGYPRANAPFLMVIIPHVSLYKKALLVLVRVQEPYSAKKKLFLV
jgi:hypothetical protein